MRSNSQWSSWQAWALKGFQVSLGLLGARDHLKGDAAWAAEGWQGDILSFDKVPLEDAHLAVVAIFVFAGGMIEERAVSLRMRLSGRRAGDLADTSSQVFAATDRIDAVFPRVGAGAAPAYAIAAESGALAGVVITADVLRAVRDGHAAEPLSSIARYDFPVAESTTDATRVYRHLREQNKAFAAVVEGDRFIGLFHADENLHDFPRAAPIA